MEPNYKNSFKSFNKLNQLRFKKWETLSFKSLRMAAIKESLKMKNSMNSANNSEQPKFHQNQNENENENAKIMITHQLALFFNHLTFK